METKIFNRLLTVLALLMLGVPAFAQVNDTLPAPPAPPADYKLNREYKQNKTFDKEKFKQNMANMSKQMLVMNEKLSEKMAVMMKDFDKKFKLKMKDFGKDFSGSFNGMVPDMAESFKSFSFNGSFNTNINSEEYRKKVASGEVIEKIKNYSKSYSVDANDVLQISNSFGKITVNTWNKNEFKVDVQMKFGSEDADAVNDMINGSSISDSKMGSTVSFKTNLFHNESRRNNNHQSIEINYTVYMPAGNPIDINNRFGSVILPDLTGKAMVKVSYGSLTANTLADDQNDVQVKFGDASIANFNSGKLDIAYGKLKTGVVNNIDADIKFSSISIDRLRGSADVHVKYGDGFRIGTIERTVKSINVDASFTKISFDFKQLENFAFDVTTKFGNFNYDDDRVKVTSKSPSDDERGWSSTKSYKGFVGKDNSGNKIVINASYTGVSFN